MNPKFEEFLRQEFSDNHADGIPKDDMYDACEEWINDLDAEELEFYEKKFNQQNI